MQRRLFLLDLAGLSAITALPGLAGCAPAKPLNVAISSWIGYETLGIAKDFGWLSPSVQISATKDLGSSAAALQSGSVDAACLTLDEVLRIRTSGVDLTVVLVFDISAGADVVLARPDILTPEQISGKRIGLENNALGALMLHKLLEAAKLPESAVTLVDCPPEVQVDAWRNDTIDVVITYEPAATAQQRLGAKRIFDSRQMPDTIFDVLAVRTDRADARQDALRDIAAAHFRGLSHIQKNRHDALHRIAARQKMSFDEANRALIGILLPSLSANREYLAATDGRLLPAARLLSSLMVQRLLISHQDTLAGLVNGVWLPNDDSSRA